MPSKDYGMLVTSMNITDENEAEFNLWFDKEHLEERAGIPGFESARRYIACAADRKYLSVYTTDPFSVLGGEDYHHVLANPTQRSVENQANFIDPGRIVAHIEASYGKGWGSYISVVRLRPGSMKEIPTELSQGLAEIASWKGFVAVHLIKPDAELSKPLGDAVEADPVGDDWFVILDATEEGVLSDLDPVGRDAELFGNLPTVNKEVYKFLWGLRNSEATIRRGVGS